MGHNKKIGKFGEELAGDFLAKKGYRIIEINVKIGYQEIDIVAAKDGCYIFLEVKTRISSNLGSADTALNSRKVRNFKKAVLKYIQRKQINENLIKLEFISVDIYKTKKIAKIKHYKNII